MNKKHFFTSFFLAIQTFRHTKMRTFLTVFGIMVGIAMVIIVLSLGRGIKGLILSEVSSRRIFVPSAKETSRLKSLLSFPKSLAEVQLDFTGLAVG